ncbi:MAG: 50S ribosomal protein L23 [Chloroflexi bacterium]|nr:50S ribosomal protein L23 [Chloroflexota bacterium]
MSLFDLIESPVITEKSTLLAERGQYVFAVRDSASKASVKEAVQKAYNVTVREVNIINVRGKLKRYGARITQRPGWKKAVVTLKSGDKIELFGNP